MTRRTILKSLAALGATWRAFAATGLRIDRVKVYVKPTLPESRFGTRQFASDDDPARWKWRGPFSQLTGSIFVEIGTKQGITGIGMGGGGEAARVIIDHHLSGLLLDADALRVEMLWDQMYSSSLFYGRRGVAIMAISGIDLALWAIIGKYNNKPVYQLLGGPIKTRVPAYFTGTNIDLAMSLGFNAFKVFVPYGPSDGREGIKKNLANLEKIREKIGPDRELMIDVLCGWDLTYAMEMLDRLRPLRLGWIEEPISQTMFSDTPTCAALPRHAASASPAANMSTRATAIACCYTTKRCISCSPTSPRAEGSPRSAGWLRWRQARICRWFPIAAAASTL